MNDNERRSLLVRLAENVMGGKRTFTHEGLRTSIYHYALGDEGDELIVKFGAVLDGWNPLERIEDAWMLVEALERMNWQTTLALRQFEKYPEDRMKCHGVRLVNHTDDTGKIIKQEFQSFSAHADTIPLAICLAADDATRSISANSVSDSDSVSAKKEG